MKAANLLRHPTPDPRTFLVRQKKSPLVHLLVRQAAMYNPVSQ